MLGRGYMCARRRRPHRVMALSTTLTFVALAPAALAAQTTIGPPAVDTAAPAYDRDVNVITIDETNVAHVPGILTDVRFYPGSAGDTGDLAFLAINPFTGTFDWVGPQIEDAPGSNGAPTYAQGAVNTYTPAQTVAIPQGDALGVYQSSSGIIPYDYGTGSDAIYQERETAGASAPAAGTRFTGRYVEPRNYAFQGDFDPATQLVLSPAAGNGGSAPAGSLDQLRYLVSFEDASGVLVPDSLDATNIAISTTDGAVTDCHGNPATNPAISAAAGVYAFCVQVGHDVGTNTITVSDQGASGVANGTFSLTQTRPQPSNVDISITPNSLVADGSAHATVTARLTDASGDDFSGDPVTFTSSSAAGPSISPASTTADSVNQATATLTASRTAGTYTIFAQETASGVSASAQVVETVVSGPTPTPTPTPRPTPTPTPKPKATHPGTPTKSITYQYRTGRHTTIRSTEKLTNCRATYAGAGLKRHRTGTSCRLALVIRGMNAPRASRARLTRSGTTVGTGQAHGTSVTLTIISSRLKTGTCTLIIVKRRMTEKVTLQVRML